MTQKFLVMYGPDVIDGSDDLQDAKQKRRDQIDSGAPSSLYIWKPSTGSRWY